MSRRALFFTALGSLLALALGVVAVVLVRRAIESPASSPNVSAPAAIEPAGSPAAPSAGLPSPPAPTAVTAATLDFPAANEVVPRVFEAGGTCGPLSADQHLVLAVQTGRVYSPKGEGVEVTEDRWRGMVREFGVRAGGMFHLCLFLVDEAGYTAIMQWHEQGRQTKSYPPFREVPGGLLLARTPLRLENRQPQ